MKIRQLRDYLKDVDPNAEVNFVLNLPSDVPIGRMIAPLGVYDVTAKNDCIDIRLEMTVKSVEALYARIGQKIRHELGERKDLGAVSSEETLSPKVKEVGTRALADSAYRTALRHLKRAETLHSEALSCVRRVKELTERATEWSEVERTPSEVFGDLHGVSPPPDSGLPHRRESPTLPPESNVEHSDATSDERGPTLDGARSDATSDERGPTLDGARSKAPKSVGGQTSEKVRSPED